MESVKQLLDSNLKHNEIHLIHVIMSHAGSLCANCNCFDGLNDDKLCKHCQGKKTTMFELNQVILSYHYGIGTMKGYNYPHFTNELQKHMYNTIYAKIWGPCQNCLQQKYRSDLDDDELCEICVDYIYDQMDTSDDEF